MNSPGRYADSPATETPPDSLARSIIERRIRDRGPVLDMPLTQSIYKPLLEQQSRDGVAVEPDCSYGQEGRQRLDIYRPVGGTSSAITLIYFPGGGFIRGDKSDKENIGFRFAREGFTTIVANYRLAPTHKWPSGAEDVISAYRVIRARAAEWGGSPDKVLLIGESAGAAHVAAATLMSRFHPEGRLTIAGTILVSGVYNAHLERMAREQFDVPSPDPRNEAYFGREFDKYPSMSTIDKIDSPHRFPMLITYAELDLLQMQVQACELFARLVTKHGFNPRLKVIRGHNHLSQSYAVNTGDESLSGPIIDFIRSI